MRPPRSYGLAVDLGDKILHPGPDRIVMFQEYGLFPWLTVAENVEFGLLAKGVPAAARKATVQKYLQANPRSCQIALDKNHSAASSFGASGFPHYVLIDRQGNIVGVAP